MEGTVYVAQEPIPKRVGGVPVAKDLSSANRYGKIRHLLKSNELVSQAPGPALNKMSRELKDFNPSCDYLCMVGGDFLSIALALLALRNMNFREVQLLRWERERSTSGERTAGGFYVPVTVPLHQ